MVIVKLTTMQIGIPRESLPGENRVAATPISVPQLTGVGAPTAVAGE
ncbi:MAG: hypothetical protein QM286_06815 [Acidobacteriota bacterium]|nr:hypothetical protein [Acidobacteriota bacterium]